MAASSVLVKPTSVSKHQPSSPYLTVINFIVMITNLSLLQLLMLWQIMHCSECIFWWSSLQSHEAEGKSPQKTLFWLHWKFPNKEAEKMRGGHMCLSSNSGLLNTKCPRFTLCVWKVLSFSLSYSLVDQPLTVRDCVPPTVLLQSPIVSLAAHLLCFSVVYSLMTNILVG